MGRWISVEKQLPELPDLPVCDVWVIACKEGDTQSRPMIYRRSTVRGKPVERWVKANGGETYRTPDFWQYPPEPPKRKKTSEKECEPND